MTSVIPDPWICIADLFSKWIRIKILMVLTMTWLTINLALSILLGMSSSGDLGSISFSDGSYQSDSDWATSVCDASPYNYLRPFAFTYSRSNGYKSSVETTCGYATTNSAIRYTISSVGILSLLILFFKTPVSVIARQILVMLGLLHLVVFILDANDTEVGLSACNSGFLNTFLNTDLASKGVTLNCTNSSYAVVAVIDFILSVSFFLLHTAWALTKDLYVAKK